MESNGNLDTAWLLMCTALVFVMQAGFCCLETGLVRTKNSINVASKNIVDICLASTLFWLFGFALMFGESVGGIYGASGFFFDANFHSHSTVQFLFQLTFCGVATTIVSGAVSERMRFGGYVAVACLISGLFYPLFGHWVWADGGWLGRLGFIDFAGSTVVHSMGAWIALAACLLIGPRTGRFDGSLTRGMMGHNLPIATVGVLLLWFGWFGFNGGSQQTLNETTPSIILATMLAGVGGGAAALAVSWPLLKRPDLPNCLNGILGGLVSITASCNLVSPANAIVIGMFGGLLVVVGTWLMERMKIDDVVSAVPVHGFAGVWGTLAVALFTDPIHWSSGLGRWEQLGVQLLGAGACFVWAFGGGLAAIWLVNLFVSLRVTVEEEIAGLNVSEHQAATELGELLEDMESHSESGDFSTGVAVESFTEVGQIAAQYNRVLAVVNAERRRIMNANASAQAANKRLALTKATIEQKLAELAEFNELAVDRELRMIELKQEINELCERVGIPPRYEVECLNLDDELAEIERTEGQLAAVGEGAEHA